MSPRRRAQQERYEEALDIIVIALLLSILIWAFIHGISGG